MKLKFIIPAITVALLASGCSGDTGAESDQALHETFKNPGAQWRGKPFWAWNGRLEKDELMRQLGVFRDMGMGGAFMHSRVGLQTEYLGSEWFDLTNAVADSAARMVSKHTCTTKTAGLPARPVVWLRWTIRTCA